MKRILLPVLLAITISGFSQKIANKLSFKQGQKLEVTTNMDMNTQMMMGETTGNTTTTEIYDVKEASPTAATLEKSTKALKLKFSMMGQEKSFDSDKPEDLKGDMGEPLKKVLDAKEQFTIDGTGKITSVKTDDTKKAGDDANKDMMNVFMSQMKAGAGPLKAGYPSMFQILPNKDVNKGDTWTDSLNFEGNHSRTIYTVKDITPTEILLDFTGDGNFMTTQQMMGMSMDIKGTTKGGGTVTLDKKTGLLKQRTMTMNTETNTSVSGQDISATTKNTVVTTVKPL